MKAMFDLYVLLFIFVPMCLIKRLLLVLEEYLLKLYINVCIDFTDL